MIMKMNFEMDNLLAIVLIGAIAIVSMYTKTADSQIVTSVVSGLIGYMAKGVITKK